MLCCAELFYVVLCFVELSCVVLFCVSCCHLVLPLLIHPFTLFSVTQSQAAYIPESSSMEHAH